MWGYMGNAGCGYDWIALGIVVLAQWLFGAGFSRSRRASSNRAPENFLAEEATLRPMVALKCTTQQSKGVLP